MAQRVEAVRPEVERYLAVRAGLGCQTVLQPLEPLGAQDGQVVLVSREEGTCAVLWVVWPASKTALEQSSGQHTESCRAQWLSPDGR